MNILKVCVNGCIHQYGGYSTVCILWWQQAGSFKSLFITFASSISLFFPCTIKSIISTEYATAIPTITFIIIIGIIITALFKSINNKGSASSEQTIKKARSVPLVIIFLE